MSTIMVKDFKISTNAFNINPVPGAKKLKTSHNKWVTSFSDILNVPTWNTEDYVKYRAGFVTQGCGCGPFNDSKYSDRTNLFYKLYFDFNTTSGLLGSLLQSDSSTRASGNNAYNYLNTNCGSARFSPTYRAILNRKKTYLRTFGKILYYITDSCPWFIQSVSGLDTALKYNFREIVPADENSITIKFRQDALDLRISTLIDLYRAACYDLENFREVIPENLRKFDMYIILFNPTILSDVFDGVVDANVSNTFKCLVLKNCEIKLDGLSSFTDSIDNGSDINGEYSITITYQRSYPYMLNKVLWAGIRELDDKDGDGNNDIISRTKRLEIVDSLPGTPIEIKNENLYGGQLEHSIKEADRVVKEK